MVLVMVRYLSVDGGGGLVVHAGQDGVQAAVTVLRLLSIAVDPAGHQLEHLGFQVPGAALRVPAVGDQAAVLEHLEVLGDGLDGHLIRRGQLVDGRVTDRQPGDQVAAGRVGQGREDSGQLVIGHRILLGQSLRREFATYGCAASSSFSTDWLNKTLYPARRICQPMS
jgi:hypothetical protein